MSTPLRLARERRQMTASQVAAAVGVSRVHISKIESGAFTASPAIAKKLAEFFGAPLTRDQILFPEEYIKAGGRRPVGSKQPSEAAA